MFRTLRRRQREQTLNEEIRFHLEQEAQRRRTQLRSARFIGARDVIVPQTFELCRT